LAETGLFNGLQRIQIEKSGRSSTRASGCEQNGSTSKALAISGHQGIISKFLIFAKGNQSQKGECSGPGFAPVGSCGVAMVFQYNRIYDHSHRYFLLLPAASTATATTAWDN
jgi:hypothetical protein